MKFYLAPLEGITGYIYRNAYRDCFGQADKYFIPFIQPKQKGNFSAREKKDILPEHNRDMNAIPQILTNHAEDFLETEEKLWDYGYREVNLNLGCPSRTVVSKGRGSGFLADPWKLDRFFEEIFKNTKMELSVKTRIGISSPEEFEEILEVYNRYSLKELIIHPRVQKDFYKNTPNWEIFEEAVGKSKAPLCYNGDLFSREDYLRFQAKFPGIESVMLGRGILRNPGLILQIKENAVITREQIRNFHDRIYSDYQKALCGDKTVLFKMKELWLYLIGSFTNGEKYGKKIRKTEKLWQYEQIVDRLFDEEAYDPDETGNPGRKSCEDRHFCGLRRKNEENSAK